MDRKGARSNNPQLATKPGPQRELFQNKSVARVVEKKDFVNKFLKTLKYFPLGPDLKKN